MYNPSLVSKYIGTWEDSGEIIEMSLFHKDSCALQSMGQVALSFWDYGLGNFGGVPDASLWAIGC